MNDITLTFGKHNGKKLSEIPRDYVAWLAENAFKDDVKKAAQAFLREQPGTESAPKSRSHSHEPGPAPRTYREASKLGWMAGKGYGNAKTTLLAARDKDGFLLVVDEEDDEEEYRLLVVLDSGAVHDASTGFSSMSYTQVEEVLARYPQIDKGDYLVKVAEREAQEADEARRRLVLQSQDGKHKIVLHIWSANTIDVTIDGREQGTYKFREPNEKERRHPQWKAAAAILEADDDAASGNPGARNIGLTPERKLLIEQKIHEVAG
jgi:hypothetical protein